MLFTATWMDLEIILFSKVAVSVQYGITYMWNVKKNDINEHIYKMEIDI